MGNVLVALKLTLARALSSAAPRGCFPAPPRLRWAPLTPPAASKDFLKTRRPTWVLKEEETERAREILGSRLVEEFNYKLYGVNKPATQPEVQRDKATSSPSPPPTKEPTFSCPLCFDLLTNPCSTFCGHIFCQSCIEAAMAASFKREAEKQCPVCYTQLPPTKRFHRVYLPKLIEG